MRNEIVVNKIVIFLNKLQLNLVIFFIIIEKEIIEFKFVSFIRGALTIITSKYWRLILSS